MKQEVQYTFTINCHHLFKKGICICKMFALKHRDVPLIKKASITRENKRITLQMYNDNIFVFIGTLSE